MSEAPNFLYVEIESHLILLHGLAVITASTALLFDPPPVQTAVGNNELAVAFQALQNPKRSAVGHLTRPYHFELTRDTCILPLRSMPWQYPAHSPIHQAALRPLWVRQHTST